MGNLKIEVRFLRVAFHVIISMSSLFYPFCEHFLSQYLMEVCTSCDCDSNNLLICLVEIIKITISWVIINGI